MIQRVWMRRLLVLLVAVGVGYALLGVLAPSRAAADSPSRFSSPDDDQDSKKKPRKKKSKKKSKKKRSKKQKKKSNKIRWGQLRKESDEKYDKRYAKMVKRTKRDKRDDVTDGTFMDGDGEESLLWTYMGHPFVVRTDISKEFTADTAMYMLMLHREYGKAYQKLLGVPADLREKIEVIVFSDRATYIKNGGSAGSGGFFSAASHLRGDRGQYWPARRYRLQQFTGGVTDFAKWEKGTLKHEAAHMELQLRLGNTLFYGYKLGVPVDCPRWWNEGHASVFEYWDFDKTVEENFAEVPFRGRYAPFIRRIHDTDKWKDFNYVWTIDPQTWHKDMTSQQGYLNYCQAWSLAAYMMSGGKKGKRDFRTIFDLSKRVGADRQTTHKGDRTRAWEAKFPERDRMALEKNWSAWVARYVSRDKTVPDEELLLLRMGYDPSILQTLSPFEDKDDAKEARERAREIMEKRKEDPKWIER